MITKQKKIPDGWKEGKLGNIVVNKGLVRGPFGGTLKKEFFVDEGYKVYEQKNAIYQKINLGKYKIDKNKFNELKRFKVLPGDFIVSCSGTIGKIFQIPNHAPEGVINQALLKIRVDASIMDDQYFYYQFVWDKFQSKIIDNTQGGAMQNLVGMQIFRTTKLLLPPLPEQCRIVEVLQTWDSYLEKFDKKIKIKKQIKKGLMQKLLTGDVRLKGFSGEWKKVRLDDITNQIQDGTHQTPKYVNEGVPFYSVEHITSNNFSKTKFISKTVFLKEIERTKIEKGDILMSRIGDIGTARYIDWEAQASFYVTLALIKCKISVYPKFIAYRINSQDFQREIWKKTLHVAFPNKINLGDIKSIRTYIPSTKEEQTAIAHILTTADQEINTLEKKRAIIAQQKKYLLNQLITGELRLPEFRS